ncbi:hypothetical protein F383_05243 [Gossypium arboreum]|uniref:Uncharacterized protein n=1 Tax=Gossypium arboreum TaxID=29729 RepID=A0A0B0NG89_GOSAR|nr:hypothetical protein F383_05243 [Gossypium arboreum]
MPKCCEVYLKEEEDGGNKQKV